MSFSMVFALKSLQALPNGLLGSFAVLDCVHGQMRRDFVEKMGYPPYFPTVLGGFKLTRKRAGFQTRVLSKEPYVHWRSHLDPRRVRAELD